MTFIVTYNIIDFDSKISLDQEEIEAKSFSQAENKFKQKEIHRDAHKNLQRHEIVKIELKQEKL